MSDNLTQIIEETEPGEENHVITETLTDKTGEEQATRIQFNINQDSTSNTGILTDWILPLFTGAAAYIILFHANTLFYEMITTTAAFTSVTGSILLLIEIMLILDFLEIL